MSIMLREIVPRQSILQRSEFPSPPSLPPPCGRLLPAVCQPSLTPHALTLGALLTNSATHPPTAHCERTSKQTTENDPLPHAHAHTPRCFPNKQTTHSPKSQEVVCGRYFLQQFSSETETPAILLDNIDRFEISSTHRPFPLVFDSMTIVDQLKPLVLQVRQAQLKQLEAQSQEEAANTFRDLDRAIRSIYELNLSVKQIPPGPLRECVKEISPYFEHRASRWAQEAPLSGSFDGQLLGEAVHNAVEHMHEGDSEQHRSFMSHK